MEQQSTKNLILRDQPATLESLALGLEELARMVAKGFEQTATKVDLEQVRQELKGEIRLVRSALEKHLERCDDQTAILKLRPAQ